ncbi:DNA cytosine methyltransferase [Nocardioides ochotonae]|uniref:DNA cytosine methyltransferase n=1 Tax=Nocardioides ochotonae TaxID=2685869 RepID=UPI00174B8BC4|nr:DNA cytosine methyltransferase [Nocardioides ochotonae]
MDAIVLFSGPGGVCEGLRMAGMNKVVGVEHEPDAVATARAAGHAALLEDVRELDPREVADLYGLGADGRHLLIQASPPCQGLSMAGRGAGRKDLAALAAAVESGALGDCYDERSPLTIEVLRWIAALSPSFVMLEQVPAALVVWEAIGHKLEREGYSVWTGYVQAEQYGVPQTRKRAILLASRLGPVSAPTPTHSRYYSRSPERLDPDVLPWVSMSEALGWAAPGAPKGYLFGQHDRPIAAERAERVARRKADDNGPWVPHERDEPCDCPVTLSATNPRPNSAHRTPCMPSPTLAFGHERPRWNPRETLDDGSPRWNDQSGTPVDETWPDKRPATTVAGRGLVQNPGATANRYNGSTKSRNDGVRVSVAEAGVLQSFPADYPWQGSATSQFVQVGNAVPPLMQMRLTVHLLAGVAHSQESR